MRTCIILLFSLPAFAGEKCFCEGIPQLGPNQKYSKPYVYDHEIDKLEVINQQLNVSPLHRPQQDVAAEKAFLKVWSELMDAVPIPPAPKPLKQFQFVRNWPTVPAARSQPQRSAQPAVNTAQTVVTTNVLQGVVRQTFAVDGAVTITTNGQQNRP